MSCHQSHLRQTVMTRILRYQRGGTRQLPLPLLQLLLDLIYSRPESVSATRRLPWMADGPHFTSCTTSFRRGLRKECSKMSTISRSNTILTIKRRRIQIGWIGQSMVSLYSIPDHYKSPTMRSIWDCNRSRDLRDPASTASQRNRVHHHDH
jgi:hypothetical protein